MMLVCDFLFGNVSEAHVFGKFHMFSNFQVNVTISCQDLILTFAMFWAQHVVLVVDYAMDGFQIVGGDNATECEVNRTKSQLRRTNALGRGPANAHVDQLSARRLLRLPGLLNVLNAIGNVRNKVKLALGHEPKDFLVLDKHSSWLFEWFHARGKKEASVSATLSCGFFGCSHMPYSAENPFKHTHTTHCLWN